MSRLSLEFAAVLNVHRNENLVDLEKDFVLKKLVSLSEAFLSQERAPQSFYERWESLHPSERFEALGRARHRPERHPKDHRPLRALVPGGPLFVKIRYRILLEFLSQMSSFSSVSRPIFATKN